MGFWEMIAITAIRNRLDRNATSMTQHYHSIFGRMEKKYNDYETLWIF